jgi:hypothetical protein
MPLALIGILHGKLDELGHLLEPGVARQANDVMHVGTLAVVQDALAAKARVAPKHDLYPWPCLAQSGDQQLQYGCSMLAPSMRLGRR